VKLADDLEALVGVSAALALGDADALERALARARERCEPREVEEALLQSYLFLGYPSALNALDAWRSLGGEVTVRPEPADLGAWRRRGEEVCRTVYGAQYERLRANVRRLHPDLETWMVVEGYGKVLGRPGLSLARRELCVVAVLAVLGTGVRPQLYAHLRGALNAGASEGDVTGTLEQALMRVSEATKHEAWAVWKEVKYRGGVDGDPS
jgi:4-carboxymuconolactone decarboxylase